MMTATNKIQIPDKLYFRIGDVADLLGVKPYVLRYWETEFPMISPQKSPSGQRVYRRSDVETVLMIKHLLYDERYSVEGARRRIKELRKEGELKTFKEEAVAAVGGVQPLDPVSIDVDDVRADFEVQSESVTASVPPSYRTQALEELRTLSQDLSVLTAKSIDELFSY